MPDVSLSGIEFTIKGSSDAASDSVQKLIKELNELKSALKNTEGITGLANALKKLTNVNSEKLVSVYSILANISLLDFSNIQKAADGIREIASSASAIANLGKAKKDNPVEQITQPKIPQTQQFYNAFDYLGVGAKQLWHSLERVGSALKPVISGIGQLAGMGLKGLGSMFTAPLLKATSSARGFAKSIGGVIGGFKRIVGYRIIRSIIKEITQGFQEGIKNLYGWSSAFGGAIMNGRNFKETMDSLATSSLYLKNSIGAAASPLISVLAPAIDFIVDKIVALINVINQLLSLLSGAMSWNRAIKKTKEYGDAVGGAGGAAKEAMKYLAPFDELNRLPDDNKGGGGGGGGTDYSGMFENVTEFNEGLKDFVDSVKDAFNRGDWESLGTILGEKVNEIVDKIPWAEAGQKVGYYINGWFSTKYWTLETINFQNIGAKVADFLNNAIAEIDFGIIGRLITQKMTIIGDFIIGAIQNINWSNIGKSFGDFFRGAFDQLSEWISSVNWSSVGSSIYNGIKNAITGVDFASLAQSVFTFLGSALGAAVSFLSGIISDVVKDIKDYFMQYITDENGDGSFGGKEIINGILNGMKNAIKGVGTWLRDNIITPIANGFISNLGEPIENAINQMIDKINEFMANHPKLSNFFGFDQIEHIKLPVTPELDPEPTKFYNDTKKDLDNASKKKPLALSAGATLKTANTSEIDGTDIETNAKFTDYTRSFKNGTYNGNGLTPQIPSIVQFNDYLRNFSNGTYGNDKTIPLINSRANLTSYGKNFASGTTAGNRTEPLIDSRANFISKSDVSLNKTFDTVANFTQKDVTHLDANIPTLANFYSYVRQFDTPTMSVLAGFYSYVRQFDTPTMAATAAFWWFTQMFDRPTMEAFAELVDAWWKDGETPTFEANVWLNPINNPGNVLGGYGYAKGGAYYGGTWHDIPQAASGGKFHGSLFWAGENGAEIVGHAGGRTEVLNRSQLAATMYAAVHSAMGGVSFNVSSPSGSGMATDDGANEDMLYRAFLRALNDSDFDDRPIELDGEVIYRNVVNHNKQEKRRSGLNPMLAI